MPQIIDYSPPTSRHYGTAQLLAWVVIAVSVALIAALPFIFAQRLRLAAVRDSELHPDVQLEVGGRYLVGGKALLSMAAAKSKKKPTDPTKTLLDEAKCDADRLRIAIVRGELDGKAAALEEIDSVGPRNPDVTADAILLRQIYAGENPSHTTPEWQNFQNRHGWFANLAASFGKPDTDPLRAATLAAAFRTFVGGIAMLLISLGAAFIGLILLIVAIVFWAQGKVPFAFGRTPPLPADRSAYIEAFAFYLGGAVAIGFVIHYVLRLAGLWGTAALPAAFAVAILWPRMRGQTWSQWRAAVGLHTGTGLFHELAWGALAYLAGLPIFAGGIIITMLLSAIFHVHPTHPIVNEIKTDPWAIAGLLLLASVWAPITEELMFRGTLYTHLRERLGPVLSALIVSILFAAIHPQGFAAIPALASLAFILAAIREWRGSILGCMMAHAINNTLLIIALVWMIS